MREYTSSNIGSWSGHQKWINIFGDVQLIGSLGRMRTQLQRKVVREAIKDGLVPIVDEAKKRVPVDHGHLRRAIKSKVTKMVSGKVYVDPKYVAVRRARKEGFYQVKLVGRNSDKLPTTYKKLREAALAKGFEMIQPARYAGLVEFGTKHAKAHPFMRPARDYAKAEAMNRIETRIILEISEMANREDRINGHRFWRGV